MKLMTAAIVALLVLLTGCGEEVVEKTNEKAQGPTIWIQSDLMKKAKFDVDAFRDEFLGKTMCAEVEVNHVENLGAYSPDLKNMVMVISRSPEGGDVTVNFAAQEGLYDRLRAMMGMRIEIEGRMAGAGTPDGVCQLTFNDAKLLRLK
ncbi:MAG: hypothetical protein H6807_06510 [Planctomycetes bacterium]|nr:hypothetical protein [Planctomycetota bacterium]